MTGPVRVLAQEDVYGVVLDLAVVGVQGRRPGQLHRPRVELHHQRLAWGARHVCNTNAMGHSQNIFVLFCIKNICNFYLTVARKRLSVRGYNWQFRLDLGPEEGWRLLYY